MEALTIDVVRGVPGLGAAQVLLGGAGHRPRPRDQWLRLFAQGGPADTAPGSGWLARQADVVSRPAVLTRATSDEVLGIGRAWKALETWTFARKLTVVRELIRRHPKDERYDPDAASGLPGEWEPSLHHEIAAALVISTVAAGKLVRLAWTLDNRLRDTSQALEDGRLDPARVKLIVDETSVLADEALYPRAEAIILAGLPGCATWGALQRLIQRAVITVDPDGAKRRREQAEREHARLRFWRENSGTCAMQATGLPTDEALAANANIEARARAYKGAGVERPMDILRVMAYLDLLNGVTVMQRAAWAQADDAARAAEEADRQARERTRDAASGHAGQNPEAGGGPDTGPDGGAPEGDPDTGGPSGDGALCRPDGGTLPGGLGDDPPVGGDGGYPGDWPADDDGPGDGGLDDEPTPEDPGGGHGNKDPDRAPCRQCGGTRGGTGLPVRASLTIPAEALDWLAGWAAGTGAGGGGPGQWHLGGPGRCQACGSGQGSASLPAREHLVLPLLTLTGLADRPGEAHGLGALDAALVRDLAAAGARHPGSRFCVTVTGEHGFAIGHGCLRPMRGKKGTAIPVNPDRVTLTPSGRSGPDGGYGSWIVTLPGAPLPFITDIDPVPTHDCDHRFETRAYRPGDRLRHLVQVRDGACSFPACSRQAHESDFEHATPYGQGGRTCACNAHSCSRSCHRAKQARGWRVSKPRPGWTQWTTRAGRAYRQEPWRYPALLASQRPRTTGCSCARKPGCPAGRSTPSWRGSSKRAGLSAAGRTLRSTLRKAARDGGTTGSPTRGPRGQASSVPARRSSPASASYGRICRGWRHERLTFAGQIMLGIGRLAITLYQPGSALKRIGGAVLAGAVTAGTLAAGGWRSTTALAVAVLAILAAVMWVLHSDDRTTRLARLIHALRDVSRSDPGQGLRTAGPPTRTEPLLASRAGRTTLRPGVIS